MSESARAIDTSLFDMATSPADDFYRYVNGGWLDANPVPPEYSSWGAFHEVNERNQELLHRLLEQAAEQDAPAGTVRRKVGDYFAAAMDEDAIVSAGTEPLAAYLGRIDAIESVSDIHALNCDLLRSAWAPSTRWASPRTSRTPARTSSTWARAGWACRSVTTTSAMMNARSLCDGRTPRTSTNQLINLGRDDAEAREAAEQIVAFETRLAEASYTAEQMRDVQLTMNRHDVASLDELMPDFGLSSYVVRLGVTSPTVNVDNSGFFEALQPALAETPLETLRDYLRWHLVSTFASSLAPAFENEAFDFYGKTLGGQKELRPRWKRVLDAATNDIGELVAQLFVEEVFPEHAKERCERMVDHLLSAMGEAIRNAEWMGEATKAYALEKLGGFTYKIGYPDQWRDYSALAIERGPHVANRMRAAAFEYDREIGRLGEPVDKAEWAMPAHQVNAYYHPLLNEVVFPAGILQPPFFYAEADDAVNFGAIGAVIGHEITHGFDDQGSRFDANGALRDWWTEEDRAEFDRRAQVLVEQFEGYAVDDDLHVNGRLTLGENIADLGGLKIAYDALRETRDPDAPLVDAMTPEQRFFLSWARVWRTNYTPEYLRLIVNVDPHSPARFRVNGPLGNMPAFAEAFGLVEGSPMVRPAETRAHIW